MRDVADPIRVIEPAPQPIQTLTPQLAALPAAAASTALLLAQQDTANTASSSLAIAPGDSPALITAKLRAFVIDTFLQILAELPIPAEQREKLVTAAQESFRRIKREVSDPAVRSQRSQSEELSLQSELQSASRKADLPRAIQPHQVSLEATPKMLQRIFSPPSNQELIKLTQTVLRDPAANAEIKEVLNALITEMSDAGSVEVVQNGARQQIFERVREAISTLSQVVLNGGSALTEAPRLNASQWRVFIALQDLVRDQMLLEQTGEEDDAIAGRPQSPKHRTQQSKPSVAPQVGIYPSTNVGRTEPDEFQALSRSVFFEAAASSAAALQPHALSAAAGTISSAAESSVRSSAPVRIDTSSIVGLLASRLVTAYRLSPSLDQRKARKRSYEPSEQKDRWLLNFALSAHADADTSHNVDVLVERNAQQRLHVRLRKGDDESAAQQLAAQAREVSRSLNVTWIDWFVGF